MTDPIIFAWAIIFAFFLFSDYLSIRFAMWAWEDRK